MRVLLSTYGSHGGVEPLPGPAVRLGAEGVGVAHDRPTPTFESRSAALRIALASETRARVTAVAGTIRTDGATRAATPVLDTIGGELS